MNRWRLDSLLLYSIPWVAALSCLGGIAVGKLRHTGLLWMLTLALGIHAIVLKDRSHKITFPWMWWAPFYFYTFLSFFWSDLNPIDNLQPAVQMSVFFVVGIVSSFAVRNEDEMKKTNWMYLAASLFVGIVGVYFLFGPGKAVQGQTKGLYTGFAERPAAMTLLIVGAIFLAQFRNMPVVASLAWASSLIVSIISGGRMVSLLMIVLWILHPRLVSLSSRIVVVGFAMLIMLVAFNTPIIQERFFAKQTGFSGKGGLEDVVEGRFDSSGRFKAWPKIFKEACAKPIFGHGSGESAEFVYKVWAPMDKPHNEYLRLSFEGGLVSLALFLIASLGTLWNLHHILATSPLNGNWPAAAAHMGFIAFLLLAFVDNPLVCGNNFMHPLFALIGAANGIHYAQQSRAVVEAPDN